MNTTPAEGPAQDQAQDRAEDPSAHIVVLAQNQPGVLAEVAGSLAEAGLNIEQIDGRLIGALGVIVLRTNDDDAALHALLDANLRAVSSEQIIFHLHDQPGALAAVTRRFADHQINVRTIHIVHRHEGEAVVAVTTDDDPRARTLLDPDSLL